MVKANITRSRIVEVPLRCWRACRTTSSVPSRTPKCYNLSYDLDLNDTEGSAYLLETGMYEAVLLVAHFR